MGNIDLVSLSRQGDGPLSLNVTKTSRPPGVWAATPAPAHLQTPQPASSLFTSAKLSRTRSNLLPQTSFTDGQSSIVVSPSARSRAGTLSTRTPVPSGIWSLTPGSLHRKNPMKVHFNIMTSDSATSEADTGAKGLKS